jgi:protein-tyrosine phosphatase
MPEVVDWQTVAQPRAVVRRAVELLRRGGLATLPTETSPVRAAWGLDAEAVRRLHESSPAETPLTVAVGAPAAARDWLPALSPLGRRLTRRLWPGPLTLACAEGAADGLLAELPEAVRPRVCPAGQLRLRGPAHELLLAILAGLPGPLLMAADGDGTTDLVVQDTPGRYPQGTTVVEVHGSSWKVLQTGAVSEGVLQHQAACLVVFICTGNTCRSPLAEALCKKRLADRLGCTVEELPARGFLVLSAGLAAAPGDSAATEAVAVAREYGADLGQHRSRPLTLELAAQADELVTMTRGHLQALSAHLQAQPGIARPRLLCPDGHDVEDPIGQSQQVYQECGRQIWQALETLVAHLQPR